MKNWRQLVKLHLQNKTDFYKRGGKILVGDGIHLFRLLDLTAKSLLVPGKRFWVVLVRDQLVDIMWDLVNGRFYAKNP